MKIHLTIALLALPFMAGIIHAQAPQTLIDWNHSWKFFQPMGTFPAASGNFMTTWYLPDAQYNSPLPFGAATRITGDPAVLESYDSGIGAGPIGYDVLNYVNNAGAAAEFQQPAGDGLLTIPATGNRRGGYAKTTFTVPAGGLGKPVLEFLMDDGGYIYLDGTLVAAVNIAAGVADAYTSNAANATNTEDDVYTMDLSVAGAQSAPGKILNTRLMPVNVVSPVAALTAGTHTLAVSMRNATQDSSDLGLALKLTAQGGCSFNATAGSITRDQNGTPGNPADDKLRFTVAVSAGLNTAASWSVTASAPGDAANPASGAYGTSPSFSFPTSTLPGSAVTLVFKDAADAACTVQVTVTAPAPDLTVTETTAVGTDFTLAAATPAASSYVRPPGGTELGWTGGSTNIHANTQPAPNSSAKYLDINGKTPAGDFLTERALVSSTVQYVTVSADLGAYTISTTTFEVDDAISVVAEASNDPAFANPTQFFLFGTVLPPTDNNGLEYYDTFKVASPDAINYGVVPFPTEDFPLVRRSVTFPRGTNTYVRLRISGGVTEAGSEHALVDNIRFSSGVCTLTAAQVPTRENHSNDNTADDEFSADVTVTAIANAASTGWTSSTAPASGLYGQAVTFGPFPVSGGARTFTLTDNLNPACSLTFTITPPPCTITATVDVNSIARTGTGTTTLQDDVIEFDVTVAGTGSGTGWRSNIPIPAAPGTFYSGTYGAMLRITANFAALPATITVSDSADAACTSTVPLAIPDLTIYAIGDLTTLGGGGPSLIASSTVPAGNGWKNPANGVLTMDNPANPAPAVTSFTISTEFIDLSAVGMVRFTADLRVSEDSTGSNFEAADIFKATLTWDSAMGQGSLNLVTPYDADGSGIMNGYDDIAATPYDTNPLLDEFNRPPPGVIRAASIIQVFTLAGTIPANADGVLLEIEGLNNSATEHFRLENIHFVEQTVIPTDDADGDGVSDSSEAIMGTDPANPNSVLRLSQSASNPRQFSFAGTAGRFYRFYQSDDSLEATHLKKWVDTGFATISGAGAHTLTLSVQPGETRRFYRLHVMQADGPWPATVP